MRMLMKIVIKKFSIVIPVYDVERYLRNCLDSIINQTFSEFEAIIVCDKCSDNSEKIVDEYVKKYDIFKKIYAEHTGLSTARNIGVNESSGEYILFLDGDDFLNTNCLEKLNSELEKDLDVLRFQAQEVKNDIVIPYNEQPFNSMNGEEAFNHLIKYHFVENSWCYCYKREFFKKHDFKFMENCIAEDYGLTPLIIGKAEKVKSISYIGYNYVQRENSLMNTSYYSKKVKKMEDMIKQADFLKEKLKGIDRNSALNIFINNSLIYYSTTLKYTDYKKYCRILKQKNCFNHLKVKDIKGKIRNSIIKISPYFFHHFIVR